MKPFFLIFIALVILSTGIKAQTVSRKFSLNENTIVEDSAGRRYPYPVWHQLFISGNYELRRIQPITDSSGFMLVAYSAAEKDKRMKMLPKPAESKFFTTGENIKPFIARDINGNKFKIKDLLGKVVVLNFWFIGCPPCRAEIPELNKIALAYADNPGIVFIAIALDDEYDVKQFTKNNPFGYHIIPDGRDYANLYGLNLYPTNVVLDKEGKVRFHGSGYATNTPFWIKKTIDEAK